MPSRISSRQNAIVKRFRDVARGAHPDLMLLDGEHLLSEAIRSGIRVETVAFGGRVDGTDLVGTAERAGAEIFDVTDQVLAARSPVLAPSGVVAIAARRAVSLEDVFAQSPALVVMLSGVQDPGNVGATI